MGAVDRPSARPPAARLRHICPGLLLLLLSLARAASHAHTTAHVSCSRLFPSHPLISPARRYAIALSHALGILHNAYFVLVEFRALFKMSRYGRPPPALCFCNTLNMYGPEFDEEMRVRPFNSAILSGATDVIAVKHADGSIRHSALHVRFGWRSGVFRGGDLVDIFISGTKIKKQMKIGSNGVAHFVHENDDAEIVQHLSASSSKEPFDIRFAPRITLWGKEITPLLSHFINVNIQTKLFLWSSADKVVICDIDGTITRSDEAGHFLYWARKWKLPILSSKDFTHRHVVDLLNAVAQQNYKIIFLTARNIGYAGQVDCTNANHNS
jgi:hypothetical protein